MATTERSCNNCDHHVQGGSLDDAPAVCWDCCTGYMTGNLPHWTPLRTPDLSRRLSGPAALQCKEAASTPDTHLPTDAKLRKGIPIYSGVLKYFPDAIAEIAELSRIGNDQHNPGKPLFWDRSKSGDELDALSRHLLDAGTRDSDKVRHSTKVAWRALANLQKEIEADRKQHS